MQMAYHEFSFYLITTHFELMWCNIVVGFFFSSTEDTIGIAEGLKVNWKRKMRNLGCIEIGSHSH